MVLGPGSLQTPPQGDCFHSHSRSDPVHPVPCSLGASLRAFVSYPSVGQGPSSTPGGSWAQRRAGAHCAFWNHVEPAASPTQASRDLSLYGLLHADKQGSISKPGVAPEMALQTGPRYTAKCLHFEGWEPGPRLSGQVFPVSTRERKLAESGALGRADRGVFRVAGGEGGGEGASCTRPGRLGPSCRSGKDLPGSSPGAPTSC